MKALKVTISGSYRDAKKDLIDFENLVGIVPEADHDVAAMHVRDRFAAMWLAEAKDKDGEKLYKERVDSIRNVFIDNIEVVEHNFTFFGKNIKEMSEIELQELALYKDLRRVPLPKRISGTDIRDMRVTAYCAYSDLEHGTDMLKDKDQPEFNFASLPELVVTGKGRKDTSGKLSNDDVLEQEQRKMEVSATPKSNMTFDQLRKTAKDKGIPFTQSTSFDDLYKKIYGGA
jgi:hypothetical protein